ncbi:GNAT family N-acetyltransferase [Marisediminicola senii]|uniref:GNAT family N-acetyltransferase n=1 Tax=Marisediminicola senii TaxID=2711233 RepID=UPI001F2D5E86|nr:GNAT family N-acetyltransferase [Marisediminicola senii]
MTAGFSVRRPELADVAGMAKVHVDAWRETYRGIMRDDVLDDPALLSRREEFWTAALTHPRYAQNRVAVAVTVAVTDVGVGVGAGAGVGVGAGVGAGAFELAGTMGTPVGVAMSGPSMDDAGGPRQLYVLYVSAAFHGAGVGLALLKAVIDRTEPASLWVADPNPRAQAFYRRHGFVVEGNVTVKDGVRELRMVRPAGG